MEFVNIESNGKCQNENVWAGFRGRCNRGIGNEVRVHMGAVLCVDTSYLWLEISSMGAALSRNSVPVSHELISG